MFQNPSPSQTTKSLEGNVGKYRSTNCKVDQTPSALFTFFAHNQANDTQEFQSFMLSCQKGGIDTPDDDTLQSMKRAASSALSKQTSTDVKESEIKIDAHGIALGVQGVKNSATELSKRKMASNCGPTYNLNNITNHNRFVCRYLGTGIDEKGRKVQNPYQTWKGTLPSCEDSMEVSDDVEADVRRLAWEAAGGEEAQLDVNQFLCSIQSIPLG